LQGGRVEAGRRFHDDELHLTTDGESLVEEFVG
jgi:hypothetical protein